MTEDINSHFTERVGLAIGLMNEDAIKALDSFNGILDDLFNLSPHEIGENDLSTAIINSLNAKGSILNAWDEIDDAEECFDTVLNDFDKTDFTSLINKALILRKRGLLEESLSYYDRIAESYPDKREFILALESEVIDDLKPDLDGVDLNPDLGKVDFKDLDLKSDSLNNSLGLDDCSDEVLSLIDDALSYKEKNLIFEAFKCLEKAIDNESSCRYLALALMDELKAEFFKLFFYEDIDINQNESFRKKGSVLHYLFIQHNYFYAYSLNDEILEENADDLFALNAKGMIMFLLDDCEDSLKYFDRSIEVDGSYPYPYFNRALALKRMGRMDDAKKSYGDFVELVSNSDIGAFRRVLVLNAMYGLGF